MRGLHVWDHFRVATREVEPNLGTEPSSTGADRTQGFGGQVTDPRPWPRCAQLAPKAVVEKENYSGARDPERTFSTRKTIVLRPSAPYKGLSNSYGEDDHSN